MKSPLPPTRGAAAPSSEHRILGLGPITMSVPDLAKTDRVLQQVLSFRPVRQYDGVHVYEMGAGGAAAELHVAVEPDLDFARQGSGAVHHVAFRTTQTDYRPGSASRQDGHALQRSRSIATTSKASHFREPNGILFEIATDEPGFTADEPLESPPANPSPCPRFWEPPPCRYRERV